MVLICSCITVNVFVVVLFISQDHSIYLAQVKIMSICLKSGICGFHNKLTVYPAVFSQYKPFHNFWKKNQIPALQFWSFPFNLLLLDAQTQNKYMKEVLSVLTLTKHSIYIKS